MFYHCLHLLLRKYTHTLPPSTQSNHLIESFNLKKIIFQELKKTTEDQQWQYGRDFIQTLIRVCSCDVNAAVQKKKTAASATLPKDETQHYVHGSE